MSLERASEIFSYSWSLLICLKRILCDALFWCHQTFALSEPPAKWIPYELFKLNTNLILFIFQCFVEIQLHFSYLLIFNDFNRKVFFGNWFRVGQVNRLVNGLGLDDHQSEILTGTHRYWYKLFWLVVSEVYRKLMWRSSQASSSSREDQVISNTGSNPFSRKTIFGG